MRQRHNNEKEKDGRQQHAMPKGLQVHIRKKGNIKKTSAGKQKWNLGENTITIRKRMMSPYEAALHENYYERK